MHVRRAQIAGDPPGRGRGREGRTPVAGAEGCLRPGRARRRAGHESRIAFVIFRAAQPGGETQQQAREDQDSEQTRPEEGAHERLIGQSTNSMQL
jgi:hypothetical protein